MDAALPLDDPLHALFAGKRQWSRVPSTHAVTLQGEGGPYAGRVLELSRGGVRVVIEDSRFYETGVDGFAFVIQRFPDGAEIHFSNRDLSRPVRIIRITLHDGARLALGCQFERPLTPGEAVTLGVAAEEAETPEATAHRLGWAARQNRPVFVRLQVARRALAGPYAIAPLMAAGDRALDLIVPGQPDTVAEELAASGLTGSVVLGRRALWEGGLQLVACESLDANGTGPQVRLRLLTANPLGSRVHRTLHVAARATD